MELIKDSLAYWFTNELKHFESSDLVFDWIEKLFNFYENHELDVSDQDDYLARALNHPLGSLIYELVKNWRNRAIHLSEKPVFPSRIKAIFTRICESPDKVFDNALAILASELAFLFFVDKDWTKTNLLPLFDWSKNIRRTRFLWGGFLWSPNLVAGLMNNLKKGFLETFSHLNAMDEESSRFLEFAIGVTLSRPEGLSEDDYRFAYAKLTNKQWCTTIGYLIQFVRFADNKHVVWLNRVKPFLQKCFPRTKEMIHQELSSKLVDLCLIFGVEFESVYQEVGSSISFLPKDAWRKVYKFLNHDNEVILHHAPNAVVAMIEKIVPHDQLLEDPYGYLESIYEKIKSNPKFTERGFFKELSTRKGW